MLLNYEKKALYFENNKNYTEALRVYCDIKSFNFPVDLNKRATDKVNFLLPICRKDIISKLKGRWKLVKKYENRKTNIVFSDVIEFTENQIVFSDIFKDKEKVISNQNLYIECYHSDFPTIKFGENEIWVLSFREINNEKRLIWELRVKDEIEFVYNDERGMLRNKIDREKALKEEIHTYYMKVEET